VWIEERDAQEYQLFYLLFYAFLYTIRPFLFFFCCGPSLSIDTPSSSWKFRGEDKDNVDPTLFPHRHYPYYHSSREGRRDKQPSILEEIKPKRTTFPSTWYRDSLSFFLCLFVANNAKKKSIIPIDLAIGEFPPHCLDAILHPPARPRTTCSLIRLSQPHYLAQLTHSLFVLPLQTIIPCVTCLGAMIKALYRVSFGLCELVPGCFGFIVGSCGGCDEILVLAEVIPASAVDGNVSGGKSVKDVAVEVRC
jgi:hypothetical protein